MSSSSPLSATVKESPWRLRLLTLVVLLSTAGVGVVFHYSVRHAWERRMAEQANGIARIAAHSLARSPNLQTQTDVLHQELLTLRENIPNAESITLFRETNGTLSALATTEDDAPALPTEELPKGSAVEWSFSGATLLNLTKLPVDDNTPTYLSLHVRTGSNQDILLALSLPYILLALAGILGVLALRSYAQSGRKQMQNQIDRNRLALIELATHQLGAPIATFRWWLELLADPDNKDLLGNEEIIGQISEAVDRMDTIIRSVSDASSLEKGTVASRQEVLGSLKHILQRVAESHAEALRARKQRIEIRIDPAVKPVQLDINMLSGVLNELLDNAISYSPESTTIRVFVEHGGDSAKLSVVDQGHGIPEQDLPHIFEKFTRGSNAAKYKPVGNGLGLFVCRGIIENLGGDMWIESKLNQGTAIHFTLPYAAGIEEKKG